MKTQSWLWPDHAIGKRESRELREEHNAVVNSHAELLEALKNLYEHCAMIHKHWGDGSNLYAADAAIKAGLDAIAKAEGSHV